MLHAQYGAPGPDASGMKLDATHLTLFAWFVGTLVARVSRCQQQSLKLANLI